MGSGSPKRDSVHQLIRVAGDVHTRLLDHHPSVHGEILFFVKEMEEKRKNREYERLQKAEQYSRGINEHLEDSTNIQLEHYLPVIQTQVQQALAAIDKISTNQSDPRREENLQQHRQKRVATWSAFMDTMCEKSASVDAEISDELKRVTNYYKEMENKLDILEKT